MLPSLIQFIASTKADTAGDFTAFRQQVERYLAEAAQASAILVGKDDLHASRFAIMAWVDEWVLCSALALRHEWRDRLLQSEHYQTVVGGKPSLPGLTLWTRAITKYAWSI